MSTFVENFHALSTTENRPVAYALEHATAGTPLNMISVPAQERIKAYALEHATAGTPLNMISRPNLEALKV